MTRTYAAENSFISNRMRTHGDSSACWAFSCATMIRAECRRVLEFLFNNHFIDELKLQRCLDFINKESVHKEIRNLMMIVLLPKKLHESGPDQSAYLRAAMSRVSLDFSRRNL